MTTYCKDNSINEHIINVAPDLPDFRDWVYQPALLNLAQFIDPPRNLHILDQKDEGACTGFGLAAVINYLNQQRGCMDKRVSARMLYEMAKQYDEWEGIEYSGSSCRGAIKGWDNMGVAEESLWKYVPNHKGNFTIEAAKNARSTTIGAYFRINRRISDFHSAINQAGVIYCSATVHQGWAKENLKDDVIVFNEKDKGGHCFAIVGYNSVGFWVQNSWGKTWGDDGLAIWTYEDWQQNIQDAWVLRLALETPQIWNKSTGKKNKNNNKKAASTKPNRGEIAGHFVHIDDGDFHENDKYWSTLNDVKITTKNLEKSDKYDHVLFYFHGGLNSPNDSASRIAAMKQVYKDNKIYPYHFMYDTGLMEELKDVVFRKKDNVSDRAEGFTDATDWLLEKLTRIPGRALWREMKSGARTAFNKPGAGTQVVQLFLEAIKANNKQRELDGKNPIKIHIACHSTGAIMAGWMLNRINQMPQFSALRVNTATLLAPAASVDFYKDYYLPLLSTAQSKFGINQLDIQCLSEQLELDDSVGPYRKSLLYLVSRAFEESKKTPILGMKKFHDKLSSVKNLSLIYSQGKNGRQSRSHSETHGGFDNDIKSMNTLLNRILENHLISSFKHEDLDY